MLIQIIVATLVSQFDRLRQDFRVDLPGAGVHVAARAAQQDSVATDKKNKNKKPKKGGNEARTPICAIDMGSHGFKRIVGSFEKGRYEQRSIERRTLGVGDDVTRYGRISDAQAC